MYNKISSGAVSYDVIVPSDYMIARMADEGGLLEPLTFDNIPNYETHRRKFHGHLYYDPEDVYSVPHTCGDRGRDLRRERGRTRATQDGLGADVERKILRTALSQFNNSR